MRRLLLPAAAGLVFAAAAASGAAALPAGALQDNITTQGSQVEQIHTGARACHVKRGKWWRDTRPYSKRCWASRRYWRHGLMWYRR